MLPGLQGFGTESTVGHAGTVRRVTNLDDSGAGSLRAAVEAPGPSLVVPEVGGLITLQSALEPSAGTWLMGGAGPNDGITLRTRDNFCGFAFHIKQADILLQHIRMRLGACSTPNSLQNCFSINTSEARRVVLDHMSFAHSTDQLGNVYDTPGLITLSNNIFSESLHRSTHDEGNGFEDHGMSLIAGADGPTPGAGDLFGLATICNLFINSNERNPFLAMDGVHHLNNVVLQTGAWGIHVRMRHEFHRMNLIKNLVLTDGTNKIFGSADIRTQAPGSGEIYARGNIGQDRPNDSLPETDFFRSQAVQVSGTEPYWTPTEHDFGITVSEIDIPDLEAYITDNVGARPWNRDILDDRLLSVDLPTRGGQIVDHYGTVIRPGLADSVSAGTWQTYNSEATRVSSRPDLLTEEWMRKYCVDDAVDGLTTLDAQGYPLTVRFLHELSTQGTSSHSV